MTREADARTVSVGSSAPVSGVTARGVTATWLYTVSAIVSFEVIVVIVWTGVLLRVGFEPGAVVAVLVGGLVWILSTAPLLRAYRNRTGEATVVDWRGILLPLIIATTCGVLGWALSGLWVLLLLPLAQSLQLLDWPRGVRVRLVLAVTALLIGLWIVDINVVFTRPPFSGVGDLDIAGVLSAILPATTVMSLWWWDVLIALDRARVSEARLAATQERLSVATDVHDLQGHHLQVIALQLELAERLLPADPGAALEQLRAARLSVDEARQGTRDLATRFRSVPLPDELANARDLLRAAGIATETIIPPEASGAPASIFGPVIRETTTNVLRHGGGRRAQLSLTRHGDRWRYEISNDVGAVDVPHDPEPSFGRIRQGSGLEGIARRAGDAGGSLEVIPSDDEFVVIVTVPADEDLQR